MRMWTWRAALWAVLVVASVGWAGPYGRSAISGADVEPAARRASDCATALGSNVYKCTVTPDSGGAFTDCLRFTTPGDISDRFDLGPDQLGLALGCTCKAAGSKKHPRFASSLTFECDGSDFTFEGTVARNAKTIKKGFASAAIGTSFVFSCTLDAACAVAQ